MTRSLAEISSEAGSLLQSLLQEAFELGRSQGRAELASEFQHHLSEAIGSSLSAGTLVRPRLTKGIIVLEPGPEGRATPGTVKPVIEGIVRASPDGITVQEIADRGGVKFNSVRGTLYILKNEDKVERRGDRWFPLPQKDEAPDDKSTQDASGASDHQPGAKGGEARPGGGT